jgi:geranylgeranyl pyrophosphate synthase
MREAPAGESELQRFFADERARVDAVIAARLAGGGDGRLGDAMRYSALAPGKRMRPVLAVATFRACGGRGEAIYGPAGALELIHAYSLVHDDLPDFDDESLRRGRATSHIVHGEPLALAAGFGLLAQGLAWLSEEPAPLGRDLLRIVTRAIGLEGMIGGQYLDLVSEGRALGPEELLEIHAGKTGRLIQAAAVVGGTLAGASHRLLEGLARYGDQLGLAFQIADDLLDALGEADVTGKSTGADVAAGKTTFVSVYGVEAARAHARAAAERAKRVAAELPLERRLLLPLADFVAERAH